MTQSHPTPPYVQDLTGFEGQVALGVVVVVADGGGAVDGLHASLEKLVLREKGSEKVKISLLLCVRGC